MAMMTDTYSTSDFPTVCFLVASGARIRGIANRQGNRLVFQFADTDWCEQLQERFECGDDSIGARDLLHAVRRVKRLIHSTL